MGQEAENQRLLKRMAGRGATSERRRRSTFSTSGLVIFFAYLASLGYYFYTRVVYSLDVAWSWYGWLFLALEILGAASIVGYALILTRTTSTHPKEKPQCTAMRYVIRVMIPCYKESLDIVQNTVLAAVEAEVPPNCCKHVYLCDDGDDPLKKIWMEELGRRRADCQLHYRRWPNRQRDLNGKACNLNFTLKSVYGSQDRGEYLSDPFLASSSASGLPDLVPSYPPEVPTPTEDVHEVVAIFDADMVCKQDFFLKTLPVLDHCDMVLTPPKFGNVPGQADIFNYVNIQIWVYMLPAMDAWGCVSCTGTNFVIRAEALKAVGYFPNYTVTEDYALSLELAKSAFQTRYFKKYLAEGEAPEDLSSTSKQRHCWCTGHLQVFFSKRNPLMCSQLRPHMRIIYSSGAYSCMCTSFLFPMFLLGPILAIWTGVVPTGLDARVPAGFVLYCGMTLFTLYYSRSVKHLVYLWFVNAVNLIPWYTYTRAVLGAIINHLSCGAHKISFEVTDQVGLKHVMTRSLTTLMSWILEITKVGNQAGSAPPDIGLSPPIDESCGETRIDVAEEADFSSQDETAYHSIGHMFCV